MRVVLLLLLVVVVVVVTGGKQSQLLVLGLTLEFDNNNNFGINLIIKIVPFYFRWTNIVQTKTVLMCMPPERNL